MKMYALRRPLCIGESVLPEGFCVEAKNLASARRQVARAAGFQSVAHARLFGKLIIVAKVA